MTRYRIEPTADDMIDEIVAYTRDHWDEAQAVRYADELFAQFDLIARRAVPWTRIPATYGVDGYRRNWRSHVIYWREDDQGIAIVLILHNRMDQARQVRAQLR